MRKKIEMSKTRRFLIDASYDLKWKIRSIVHFPKYIPKILKILTKEQTGIENQKYFLSIVVTVKNESLYIGEWLDYHLMIGVDHFYIYDNGSTDDLLEIIRPYIKEGLVTYTQWEGNNQQLVIYEHALSGYQDDTKWMAILDADEFLVSITEQSIIDFLKSLNNNVTQVILGWMVFGSSGRLKYERGLVLDRFRMHAQDTWIADSKPIVRPDHFLHVPIPHWVDVFGQTVNEKGEKLRRYPQINITSALPMPKSKFRINHYYCKSWEEFESKRNRGFADHDGGERTKNDFLDHDQNDVIDHSLDAIIQTLKEKRRMK